MGEDCDSKAAWSKETETELPQETAPFLPGSDSKQKPWRTGVIGCAIASTVVLIVNVGFLAAVAAHPENTPGRRTLYYGDRRTVNRLSAGVHLCINILSTILVGSSSYCMQCLSAPTREDIDNAHKKRKWLDVGILSFRNLRAIPRRRGYLWCILGITSVPLHLF